MVEDKYLPLMVQLEGHWQESLTQLPEDLHERVVKLFVPITWTMCDEEGRRLLAAQIDAQNDPGGAEEAEFWFNHFLDIDDLESQLQQLESMRASTPVDIEAKSRQVATLQSKLGRLNQIAKNSLDHSDSKDYHLLHSQPYIPYLKARKILADKFGATPDEIAAWIMFGDKRLNAYRYANELNPPARYFFQDVISGHDYHGALMACWFGEVELNDFVPAARYILGRGLIERWAPYTGGKMQAFISAKIAESRLADLHPISGMTQGTIPIDESLPVIGEALFSLNQVAAIEQEDFGLAEGVLNTIGASFKYSLEWRVENAKRAANARYDQSGGYREKREQVRMMWASGEFKTKLMCAEKASLDLGLSVGTARKYLQNVAKPKDASA